VQGAVQVPVLNWNVISALKELDFEFKLSTEENLY